MRGKLVGHYKILEKLGSGGMGEVWLAEDTRLDRNVALKFLPYYAAQDETEKARFIQEAKAAARLTHNNIAQVYEIGEEGGRLYIVMEYVSGGSLRDQLDRVKGRSLPLEKVLGWIRETAEGLAEAHCRGITHRDIKPDNLMLTESGQIKITDFGLARLETATRLTVEGATLGTVNYMSPEQITGKDVDHRTDLFSLGGTFYELLSGQKPFEGPDASATYYSILHEDPDPICRFCRGINPEIERVVNKLLEKDPKLRSQSAEDVIADFRRIEQQQIPQRRVIRVPSSISAIPPKTIRRRSLISRSVMGTATVLLLGLAYLGLCPLMNSIKSRSVISDRAFTVAVLDLVANNVGAIQALELTNSFYSALDEMTVFRVIKPEKMRRQVEKRGFECPDITQMVEYIDRFVDFSTEIGAQKIIVGEVFRENNIYTLRTRIVDMQTSQIESSISTDPFLFEQAGDAAYQAAFDLARNVYNNSIKVTLTASETSLPMLIGVLDLDANNTDPGEAHTISAQLRYKMAQTGVFQVIESTQMQSVLDEQDFQFSGASATDESVVHAGKLLGVRKMIAGSVSRVASIYSLQIRIVDIESARIEKTSFYDETGGIDKVLTVALQNIVDDLTSYITTPGAE